MIKKIFATVALRQHAPPQLGLAPAASGEALKVLSEKTVTGFGHVESVAYDPHAKVFYISDFGPALKPADKDGQGKLTNFLDGRQDHERRRYPARRQSHEQAEGHLDRAAIVWMTDIDSVWVFDLKTKKGKKLPLPGITFANDPTVIGDSLYVSDNRSDQLVKLDAGRFPQCEIAEDQVIYSRRQGVNPNGLYPGKGGTLLMAGFAARISRAASIRMVPGKRAEVHLRDIGLLDGLYQMKDGDLLATDWVSGSLFQWNKKMGMHMLATASRARPTSPWCPTKGLSGGGARPGERRDPPHAARQ